MFGTCLTCGLRADLEAHHVAGRHNHQTLTIPVCLDCHRILSSWQRSAGIELDAAATRMELDATRALVVGAMHLIRLFAQRHASQSWTPASLAIHGGRAVSKLLDALGPVDRVGRWLPDPTAPPVEATPVSWPAATEADRVAEMAHLTSALSTILGAVPPMTLDSLADIARDPTRWMHRVDQATQEPVFAATLCDLISQYLQLSEAMMARLLSLDDVTGIDESLVRQADAWLLAMGMLLDHAWSLVADPGVAR